VGKGRVVRFREMLTLTSATGHSRRYCRVRCLVRYRQDPTLPTESRALVIRIPRSIRAAR
jgi:hypothetical protein